MSQIGGGVAKIVAVHPQRRVVELVDENDGTRVGEAHVVAGVVSSDSGFWGVPSVPRPRTEQAAGSPNPTGRTMRALYLTLWGRPVVVGFLPPLSSEVAFTEQDRTLYRHPSGSYVTISPDGSIEARHPGGAHLRIGSGDSETVPAANGWNMPAASPPQITVTTSGFVLKVEPGGNVTLESQGTGTIKFDGAVTVEAPTTLIRSNVSIQGTLSVTGVGGGATAVTMVGTIALDGSMASTGDIVAGGISQMTHVHDDVQPGSGTSGPPVP